jgi:PAS domain S-box-containing protein
MNTCKHEENSVSKIGKTDNNSHIVPELYIQDVFNNAPIGIFSTTPDGRILSANAALVRLFRYESPEELMASVTDIATQMYADSADREEFRRLMEKQGEIINYECRFRRRDGTEFWGMMNVRAIKDKDEQILSFQGFISDISKQKTANEKLKRLEWMLSEKPLSKLEAHHEQGYGDLTELNQDGMVLKAIGREGLKNVANDYLDLLGTSSAIYEANGDYAFGIFSSGWCRMMDTASRRLCDSPDNTEALRSGLWLCHESCWTDCCEQVIAKGKPMDIACHGGIRMYAEPILAYGKVVGAINFGYGNPPTDRFHLQNLAEKYHLDYNDLFREANKYDARPPFIIELAKKRLNSTARLIGSMIETKQTEETAYESETRFQKMLGVLPDMISIHSPDMDILYSNWQGFGAIPEAMRKTGTKCYMTYRGYDDICPDCLAKSVLETGKAIQKETQLPDGTWIDLRVIPFLDKNDNPS